MNVELSEGGAREWAAQALQTSPRMLDVLPVAAYACDSEGRIRWFNRRAAELWGREPEVDADEERFCGAHRLLDDENRPVAHAATPMAFSLRTGRETHGTEITIVRPDGSSTVVEVHTAAITDQDGQVVGAINCFHEITRQREAERKFRAVERHARDLLEALPAAIYTTDAEGRIVSFNQASVRLWGIEPEIGATRWCGSQALFWPDGRSMAFDECPMAVAIQTRQAIQGAEAALGRPDGRRVPFLAYPMPLFDDAGQLSGAVNMLVDITELKAGEAALAESEARQRAILQTTPECVKIVGPNGHLRYMNAAGLEMIGADDYAQVEGVRVIDLVAPEHRAAWQEHHDRVCSGEQLAWEFDLIGLRGERRSMETHGAALALADGRLAQLAVSRDVTARKRAFEHQQFLINELNHRVKNTLAIVQGLAQQSFRDLPRDLREGFSGRLGALAVAHDLLTREQWQGAALQDVVHGVLAGHGGWDPARLRTEGPNLAVAPQRAVSLAMALHELCTNAIKYGALSNRTGQVDLCWAVEADRLLRLRWEERGGPPVGEPARRGFGTRMIEHGLARELGGSASISFRPEGLVCVIETPLDGPARTAPGSGTA
ncbi:sensor histidine kinase [Geminicoccus roseus]|uniref:sensor histidine kinase n=1 Tax=Geminicoccus roseus TaxID=404900 RepID=UPI0004016B86|nr:PAS domain-containing protein [Geminicoccus roseus]